MNIKKVLTIVLILLAAIFFVAVGYAAMSNVTLYINGSATATPKDENFKVKFSGEPTFTKTVDTAVVTPKITDDLNATLEVSGLSAKGDSITATYTIANFSSDLSASLSATQTNSNTEYFDVKYNFAKATITKNDSTTITVTVTLIKTPITEDQAATIMTTITATPVQPQ